MINPNVADMHVHTHFSIDSRATMESYCEVALKTGVRAICFTDHVDLNRNDPGCDFYRPDAYFEELERMRTKYDGQVELLAGLEFAEPQDYPEALLELHKRPYDFILGSQHFVNDLFASDLVEQASSEREAFELYWNAVEKMVEAGGFDALSHLDFPKRYNFGNELIYDEKQVRRILRKAIDQDICIEINTSGMTGLGGYLMPDPAIIEIYAEEGGYRVTVGSDSHRPDDLGWKNTTVPEQVPESIRWGIFRQRQFLLLEEAWGGY